MLRPMVHLLVTALLVLASTADRPGDGKVPDLNDADYRRLIFAAEDSHGNPVGESLRDIERVSLGQNLGGPYLRESFDDEVRVGADGFGQGRYYPRHRGSHNLTEGTFDGRSGLVFQQHVFVRAKRHRTARRHLSYFGDTFNITRLEARDQHTNSSDAGYVRILRGGVGANDVYLQFQSQRGRSLDYFVQIWGREELA